MAGVFIFDAILRWQHRRKRDKKLSLAARWPQAQAEVNRWQIINADEDAATMGALYQIEAGFHFTVNGEYYGGYVRSVAMGHHEAESKATGNPKVNVRYNPANPDEVAVFAEDNSGNLPFRIISA
jgi:hypothetical protein